MKPKQIPGVPIHKKGGFHDTESTKQYNALVINTKFNILKERFFTINKWKDYCGSASADFKHFDSSGQWVERIPKKGDFIRIGIPGPGTKEAEGYDWVEIVNISHRDTDNSESFLMMCRPSKVPNRLKGYIAHFYSSAATSNIMIVREGDSLKVGIYGRNERPNFNTGFIDKIRNFFISLGGMFGFGKMQWKLLADGLLNFE
ncbi:hypothetical protein QFZ37_003474 [Chryseobacterium ginsenosidimutans]|uniref:hypothetical protein n=1 Tax=Chryseobacterium ginsenosidimutans TaxID=687846 RepID=UPI002782C37A|nr:hypothetical protein [Chryseobacterium ginsenosidimutans]MDQ0595105.1 hypothetical protein [Chryseobacterium ginsenosidimutans]